MHQKHGYQEWMTTCKGEASTMLHECGEHPSHALHTQRCLSVKAESEQVKRVLEDHLWQNETSDLRCMHVHYESVSKLWLSLFHFDDPFVLNCFINLCRKLPPDKASKDMVSAEASSGGNELLKNNWFCITFWGSKFSPRHFSLLQCTNSGTG